MALILSERDNIFEYICKNLQKHWEVKLVNLRKRVRVVADLEKWKPTMVDIWEQKRSNRKEYSIYFDDEFVCRCTSSTHPKKLEVEFLKGILELYNNGKIYFNEADYKQEDDVIKQITHDKKEEVEKENKEVDKLNIDPLAKQTLKELNKEDLKEQRISKQEIEKFKEKI